MTLAVCLAWGLAAFTAQQMPVSFPWSPPVAAPLLLCLAWVSRVTSLAWGPSLPLGALSRVSGCFVKGSEKIMDRAKERLRIEPGQTTEDGLFSLEETRCVGACGLAPVFTVNGEVYGKATVQMLDQVLDKLMAE